MEEIFPEKGTILSIYIYWSNFTKNFLYIEITCTQGFVLGYKRGLAIRFKKGSFIRYNRLFSANFLVRSPL